jgi:hypothetical protein
MNALSMFIGQYDPESLILKKSLEKAAKYALETLVSFKE